MSKKHQKSNKIQEKSTPSIFNKINLSKAILFSFILVMLILMSFYKPIVFNGLEPSGGDRIGSIGKTHQYTQYNKTTGETALWNPNIFCGL
ncbi:MAG: hypothetical protein ACTSRG_24625, partial [Candidatus Helarchaeota archaeon]